MLYFVKIRFNYFFKFCSVFKYLSNISANLQAYLTIIPIKLNQLKSDNQPIIYFTNSLLNLFINKIPVIF